MLFFFPVKNEFFVLKKYQKFLDSLALSFHQEQKGIHVMIVVLTTKLARNLTELNGYLLISPDAYLNIYIKINAENYMLTGAGIKR